MDDDLPERQIQRLADGCQNLLFATKREAWLGLWTSTAMLQAQEFVEAGIYNIPLRCWVNISVATAGLPLYLLAFYDAHA